MIYEAPHILKIAEINEKYHEALKTIQSLIPEDHYDWVIHGVNASDTYGSIMAAINTAYGIDTAKLDCSPGPMKQAR